MGKADAIAVFGDWHGDIQWARLAINSAAREGVRVIVSVGDWGVDWPGPKRGLQDTRLNKALVANEQVLVLSPGNHDCLENISKLPVDDDGLITWRSNFKILPKGGRSVIAGHTVGGVGGAYSVDKELRVPTKNWFSDEELTAEQARQLIAGGPVEILISHDAPLGVHVTSQLDLPGDVQKRANRTRRLLADIVREIQPPNLLCGHHHQRVVDYIAHPGGSDTRVDVLGMEHDRQGNGVILRPGSGGLRVEPLEIRGCRPGERNR
ncbi:metallophosphoesterase [Pseudarthrobacter oxydans]|uniref:metallophosphoesterase family protein n=1 Tax=Pseudarthrobacter oxydans TaxID=1671 RepID=UPI0015748600|nr:metallophosphoesterase [Pseudarthrobacter oxydans]NSX37135.1 metallophosphoesterase [Pseudarthrobacter oxydans]